MDAWTIKRLAIALPLLGIGAYLFIEMAMIGGSALMSNRIFSFSNLAYFFLGGGGLTLYQIIHRKRHGVGPKLSFIDKIEKMQEEIKEEEKNQSFLQKRKWEFIIYGGVIGFIALIFATDFNSELITFGIYAFVIIGVIVGIGWVILVSLDVTKRITKKSQ